MRMDGKVTTLTTFLVAELPLTCSRGEVVSGESGPAAGLGSGDLGACAPLAGPSGSSQPLWGGLPSTPIPRRTEPLAGGCTAVRKGIRV